MAEGCVVPERSEVMRLGADTILSVSLLNRIVIFNICHLILAVSVEAKIVFFTFFPVYCYIPHLIGNL